MPSVEIYTDGSATTLGNPGGWAAVIVVDGEMFQEISGHMESATNNDAELEASIQGLSWVAGRSASLGYANQVTLVSDSQIILNWANGTYRFKQESKLDKFELLRKNMALLNAQTRWVRGHSGDLWNERCDKLANMARKGIVESHNSPVVKTLIESKIGSKKNDVVSVWFKGVLRVIDFETGIIENYNREVHGKRGSVIEIRESRER
jgi:ribonuclease HI